ncbi:hypothetical protein [Actinoplanes sp. GCM10030250]|uniref:hypothetical protein n=1 Tax=Actinoplanes sp. GCM10030250 TaxID=3273376 RepID=UPI0036121084
MKWFGRKRGSDDGDQEARPEDLQAVQEMIDPYHSRASIVDGDRLVLQPGQVLSNVALAMERLDNDINTPISISDFVTEDELMGMIKNLRLGALLSAHVVNTAMKIMSARYPAELVRRPLPDQYDLRKLHPIRLTDHEHETARTIFNRRTASTADLEPDDLQPALKPMDSSEQMQVFMALFFMFGTKVGAMKYSTGIQ